MAFLVLTRQVCENEESLIRCDGCGIPATLLSEERTVEVFRELGYQKSYDIQLHRWNELYSIIDRRETETFKYLSSEARRGTRLLSEAFYDPARLEFLETILSDEEKARVWMEVSKHGRECYRRITTVNDRSPAILRILENDLSELRKAGCEAWSAPTLEIAADYHFLTGNDERACENLEDALSIRIASREFAGASHLAGRIGAYRARKGDLEGAEQAHRMSFFYAQQLNDPYYISRALSFLSFVKATEGYFIEAESLQVHALEYCNLTADPTCEVSKLLALARLYNSFGEQNRAACFAERAILLAEEHIERLTRDSEKFAEVQGLSRYLASAHALLAKMHRSTGEYDQAVHHMNRALSTGISGVDRYFTAELRKLLGDICASAGRHEESARCYSVAVTAMRELHKERRVAEYLTALANLHILAGRYDEAGRLLGEAVGIARRENYWMQVVESVYLQGKVAVHQGNCRRGCSLFEEALAIFELRSPCEYTGTRHSLAELMDNVYDDIIILESTAFHNADSVAYWAERSRHTSAGELASHADLDERIRKTIAHRGWIPENAIVVQHIVTPGATIVAAMDRFGTVHRTTTLTEETLRREVLSLIDACRSVPSMEKAPPGHAGTDSVLAASRRLYNDLLRPIAPMLPGKRLLCFIHDGILAHVPFGALVASAEKPRFLVEDFTILCSHSLLDCSQREDSRESVSPGEGTVFHAPLLVGNPVISPGLKKLYPDLGHLPRSASELSAIANLLRNCTVLAGPQATKPAVLRALESAGLFHIATHTVTYPVNEGNTALVLSTEGTGIRHGEILPNLLTSDEIEGLNLSAMKLVVLSTCESARGKQLPGRSEAGLARAFLHAGARCVIAAAWPVEDSATASLMIRLYREMLVTGMDPVSSLRVAQCNMIERSRVAGDASGRIVDWAPFVPFGNFNNHIFKGEITK